MNKVQGLITLIFIILMTTKSNVISIKEFADKNNILIQIKNEIIKINPKNIILIGKDHTISQKVVDEIKSIIPNIKIDRIGGNSRYETSYIITQKIHDENNIEEIYIGNGYDEADLILIGPVAGNKKQPIVLI